MVRLIPRMVGIKAFEEFQDLVGVRADQLSQQRPDVRFVFATELRLARRSVIQTAP